MATKHLPTYETSSEDEPDEPQAAIKSKFQWRPLKNFTTKAEALDYLKQHQFSLHYTNKANHETGRKVILAMHQL